MSKKLEVGVVGLGLWGQNHPLVYDDYHRSEVAVVCDLDEERARKTAELYRCDWTTNVEELASSDVSAFSVATPDHTHFHPVSELLKAQKHVLVEKPLTTNIEEAKTLLALSEASSGISMVDYHLRWDPQWATVKDAVEEGRIGDPYMGYIRLSDTLEVAEHWLSWADQSGPHWFLFPHILDIMTWLFEEEPTKVYATGHKGILRSRGVDAWDAVQAMVSFPSGNVTLETSWVVPNSNPIVTDCHMSIYGDAGKIDYDMDYHGLSIADSKKFSYPWVEIGKKDRWGQLSHYIYSPMRYFVDCILDEREPDCTFREGMINTATIEAIVRSLDTGSPVSLSEIL